MDTTSLTIILLDEIGIPFDITYHHSGVAGIASNGILVW